MALAEASGHAEVRREDVAAAEGKEGFNGDASQRQARERLCAEASGHAGVSGCASDEGFLGRFKESVKHAFEAVSGFCHEAARHLGDLHQMPEMPPLLKQYTEDTKHLDEAVKEQRKEVSEGLLKKMSPEDRKSLEKEMRDWATGMRPVYLGDHPSKRMKDYVSDLDTEMKPLELRAQADKAEIKKRMSPQSRRELEKEQKEYKESILIWSIQM